MFEFIITKGFEADSFHKDISVFKNSVLNNPLLTSKKIGSTTISYLSFSTTESEENTFEDEHKLIIVRGSLIFNSEDQTNKGLKYINDLEPFNSSNAIDLRGHFNLIVIDKPSGDIKIINDYFGLKPVYYGWKNDIQVIGSSLEFFKQNEFSIDIAGLCEKLIFHHNLNDNTIFQNVISLKEASILEVRKGFKSYKYFDWYSFIANASDRKKFSYKGFNELFCNKVSSIAHQKDNNLITLTGGHDGRAVLSAFLKRGLRVQTFSFGRSGSENTAIPEKIARDLKFKHTSIYLEDNFENDYFINARIASILSDGELPFGQQTILFASENLRLPKQKVFTGLLAGEMVGPIHLKVDYINTDYFKYIFGEEKLNFEAFKKYINSTINISEAEMNSAFKYVSANIDLRRKSLSVIEDSPNKHMIYLADMITWGFRKFYAYQMHIMRYHFENIPVFCDIDLLNLLINSSYNRIYKNSYKGLIQRRNSRRLQISIITRNSSALSKFKLDRGYTPMEAKYFIYIPVKLYKYFSRKRRIKGGKYIPDFLDYEWPKLILDEGLLNRIEKTGENPIFNWSFITKELRQLKSTNKPLNESQIRTISLYLFFSNN